MNKLVQLEMEKNLGDQQVQQHSTAKATTDHVPKCHIQTPFKPLGSLFQCFGEEFFPNT